MGRAIYRLLIVIAFVISTGLLNGCPVHPKRVLLIGDSISFMSAGEISKVGNVVVDADPSNRMTFTIIANIGIGARKTLGEPGDPDEYWPALITNSIDPGNFDAIVIALATNDCSLLSTPGEYQRDIARIVGAISAADRDVPIFWLTMHDNPVMPNCRSIINGDLGRTVQSGTFPNLMMFDYGAWAEANPECFLDGIHLRERWHNDPRSGGTNAPEPAGYCDGQLKYANWLKAQLDGYFGPRG